MKTAYLSNKDFTPLLPVNVTLFRDSSAVFEELLSEEALLNAPIHDGHPAVVIPKEWCLSLSQVTKLSIAIGDTR